MVVWVQMILGALSLAKEIIKLVRDKETEKKKCPARMKGIKEAIKRARETGDTDELEKAFRNIGGSTGG